MTIGERSGTEVMIDFVWVLKGAKRVGNRGNWIDEVVGVGMID